MSDRIKTGQIRAALRRHFAHPQRGIVFEVAQATGFNARRHIDAIGMDLWPSHGLGIYAIEIKVSRSDWRRELQQPEKAEELARFADYFVVAAPKGVIPQSELPAAWGLYELHDDGKLVIARHATTTKAEPVTREFMAAVLRGANRPISNEEIDALVTEKLASERATIQAKIDAQVAAQVALNRGRDSGDADAWRALVSALGIDPRGWAVDKRDVIAAIKAVHTAGVQGSYRGIASLRKDLALMVERLDKAEAAFPSAERLAAIAAATNTPRIEPPGGE